MARMRALVVTGTIVLAAGLTTAGLTGCSGSAANANVTKYEVLDRFQAEDSTDPDRRYFIWIKPFSTQDDPKQKASDRYFKADERSIWDGCWLGDTFYDLVVGKDYCERTPKSTVPTRMLMELEAKHQPIPKEWEQYMSQEQKEKYLSSTTKEHK